MISVPAIIMMVACRDIDCATKLPTPADDSSPSLAAWLRPSSLNSLLPARSLLITVPDDVADDCEVSASAEAAAATVLAFSSANSSESPPAAAASSSTASLLRGEAAPAAHKVAESPQVVHTSMLVAPRASEKVPEGHGTHAAAPSAGPTSPAGHGAQASTSLEAPGTDTPYLPSAHSVHSAAPVEAE